MINKYEYSFGIGDIVRVKNFDEIAAIGELFGCNEVYLEADDIWFVDDMTKHCGKQFRVKGFSKTDYCQVIFEEDENVPYSKSINYYVFSPSMLEPIDINPKESADESSIGDFILG